MDQLGQLDDEIQHADHDALGCDGWEISAHAACAPDHEPIQGRQYGDAEFEKLNNSLQRRIGHLNCGHTANPIILGVNAPQYTEAQLQNSRMTTSAALCTMATGTPCTRPGRSRAASKTASGSSSARFWPTKKPKVPICRSIKSSCGSQAEYARFCKAVGLPTRSERLQVAGFGRSQSNRAVWAYKRLRRSNFGT